MIEREFDDGSEVVFGDFDAFNKLLRELFISDWLKVDPTVIQITVSEVKFGNFATCVQQAVFELDLRFIVQRWIGFTVQQRQAQRLSDLHFQNVKQSVILA